MIEAHPLDDADQAATSTPPVAGWPIALPASAAAALFGLSERAWWRLHSSGRCPLPIRCGRAVRWLVDGPRGLKAWAEMGCPTREVFHSRTNEREGNDAQ